MPRGAKAKPTELSKREKLQNLVASINGAKKQNLLSIASETDTSFWLRRPTGITSLDIALGGGWPAGSLCTITGPDGAGKDYLIHRTVAEIQRLYGADAMVAIWNTEMRYDKDFATRYGGVQVGRTDAELEEMDRIRKEAGQPPLTKDDRKMLKSSAGEVVLITAGVAEDGFDTVLECVRSNLFQLVVINSFAALNTSAKDETDTLHEYAQQSNEAVLITKFINKLLPILNQDRDGERNLTTILGTNQVRAKRNANLAGRRFVRDQDTYERGAKSWALRHANAIELAMHKGSLIRETVDGKEVTVGQERPWEVTKGKLGTHEGIKGSFRYLHDTGADITADLIGLALQLGILQKGGAWISWEHPTYGFKAQGLDKAVTELEDGDRFIALQDACYRAAGMSCRHR